MAAGAEAGCLSWVVFVVQRSVPTELILPWWVWAIAATVVVVIAAALVYLVYRSKNRRRTGFIVALSVTWVLGLFAAFAQLFPGVAQRLPVPLGLEGQPNTRIVTLDEAKRIADFPVYSPSHLPSRFELEEIRVQRAGKSSGTVVVLIYYDHRSNSQLEVWQDRVAEPAIMPGQANLKVMGQDARIGPSPDGTSIEWSVGVTRIEITSDYARPELIKVARSMR